MLKWKITQNTFCLSCKHLSTLKTVFQLENGTKCEMISDEYCKAYDKLVNSSNYLENCEKCFFNKSNKEKVECETCDKGFYKNSKGECAKCYEVSIVGGKCQVCSDDKTKYDSCSWYDGYTLIENSSCFKCPDKCSKCEYNIQKKVQNVRNAILNML